MCSVQLLRLQWTALSGWFLWVRQEHLLNVSLVVYCGYAAEWAKTMIISEVLKYSMYHEHRISLLKKSSDLISSAPPNPTLVCFWKPSPFHCRWTRLASPSSLISVACMGETTPLKIYEIQCCIYSNIWHIQLTI